MEHREQILENALKMAVQRCQDVAAVLESEGGYPGAPEGE